MHRHCLTIATLCIAIGVITMGCCGSGHSPGLCRRDVLQRRNHSTRLHVRQPRSAVRAASEDHGMLTATRKRGQGTNTPQWDTSTTSGKPVLHTTLCLAVESEGVRV